MIDPQLLRVLAQRFDWAYEGDGTEGETLLDFDSIAELLRAIADEVPLDELGNDLDLPTECTDPDELDA